jgi:hypothetical protein
MSRSTIHRVDGPDHCASPVLGEIARLLENVRSEHVRSIEDKHVEITAASEEPGRIELLCR